MYHQKECAYLAKPEFSRKRMWADMYYRLSNPEKCGILEMM